MLKSKLLLLLQQPALGASTPCRHQDEIRDCWSILAPTKTRTYSHTSQAGIKKPDIKCWWGSWQRFAKADMIPGDDTVRSQHARLPCLGLLRSYKYPGAQWTVTNNTFSSSPSYRPLKALPIDIAETEACMHTQNLASWRISIIHIPAGWHLLNEKGTNREDWESTLTTVNISSKLQCSTSACHPNKQPIIKSGRKTLSLFCRAVLVSQYCPKQYINIVTPSSQIITAPK